MAIELIISRVSEKKIINDKFLLIRLELVKPATFEFVAGQYILLTVPGVDEKKNYSIASMPEMNHAIELLVDITPGGVGSGYLRSLEIGEEVEFRAPVGNFVVDLKKAEEKLVFVATGSGISPFRSIIQDLLITKKEKRQIKLFWGLRQPEDMFWVEDFYQLDKDHENFGFEVIVSQPPSDWKLSQGYVTDLLAKRIENYNGCTYYLCGNGVMVKDCEEMLLEKGVGQANILYEKFY